MKKITLNLIKLYSVYTSVIVSSTSFRDNLSSSQSVGRKYSYQLHFCGETGVPTAFVLLYILKMFVEEITLENNVPLKIKGQACLLPTVFLSVGLLSSKATYCVCRDHLALLTLFCENWGEGTSVRYGCNGCKT